LIPHAPGLGVCVLGFENRMSAVAVWQFLEEVGVEFLSPVFGTWILVMASSMLVCVCLLLQYLLQSCSRGAREIVEDMCYCWSWHRSCLNVVNDILHGVLVLQLIEHLHAVADCDAGGIVSCRCASSLS